MFLTQTTTITLQSCSGSNSVGPSVPKTFQVQNGPSLRVMMTFSPASYASSLLNMTASIMMIDSRRVSASFNQRRASDRSANAQMDILSTSTSDADSLKGFVDGKLGMLLAKSGIRVLKLSSAVVAAKVPEVTPAASDSYFNLALAIGLGIGIPILILSLSLLLLFLGFCIFSKFWMRRRVADEKKSHSGISEQSKPAHTSDSHNDSITLTLSPEQNATSVPVSLIDNWSTIPSDAVFSPLHTSLAQSDGFVQYESTLTLHNVIRTSSTSVEDSEGVLPRPGPS